MSPEPDTRACPICWNTFTPTGRNRAKHTYCSGRCRAEAGRRRARAATARPAAASAATPAPTARPDTAAVRNCPHCGERIAIVALLTTPQIAGPQLTDTPGVIPLRPVRAT